MPKRPQIELSREELDRAEIPLNHILVKITRRAEGLKTHAGVLIGYNEDVVYAEGEDSHSANLAEIVGIVIKIPNALYFNPDDSARSMDWEMEIELIEDDVVWFSLLESKNSVQLVCEGELYKSIPYADCYCYKREIWLDKWSGAKRIIVGMLNGYVLCEPVFCAKRSDLDYLSKQTVDKTRGVIKFIGTPPTRYIRDIYSHIEDLRVGDEVLFDPKTPLFYLERLGMTSVFDNGKQYWCVPRRRISMILKRQDYE
jgi:hypothetical protein